MIIRYRGGTYVSVPAMVRYRGALYVVAQEEEEELAGPLDPAVEQGLLSPEEAEKVPEAIDLSIQDTFEDASKILQRYGIKFVLGEYFVEGDGLDLVTDTSTQGTPDSQIILDYVLPWFRNLKAIKTPGKLQEIVFAYCKGNFAGHDPEGMDGLLSAVALLQRLVSVAGEDPLEKLPELDEERLDWLLGHLLSMIEAHPEAEFDPIDRNIVIEQLKKDRSAKALEPAQYNLAMEILGGLSDKVWKKLAEDMLDKIRRRQQYKPSRPQIEALVDRLTAHEDYTGSITLVLDPKTGRISAELGAPYPFRFTIDFDPGSGVKFYTAHMTLCDRVYIAKTEQDAMKLFSADVDLTIAYNEGANEEISKDRSEPLEKAPDVIKEIIDRILRDPGAWLKERAERPPGEPSEETSQKLEAFKRWVADNRNQFLAVVAEQPETAKNFLERVPGAIRWLKQTDRSLHDYVRDVLKMKEVTRPTSPEEEEMFGVPARPPR